MLSGFELWVPLRFKIKAESEWNCTFAVQCSSLSGRTLRILFNINSSKIVDVVRSHLPQLHCYADDSKLYYYFFNQSCTSGQDVAITDQWKPESGRSSVGCTPTN